jgi:protein dithiol:quinone oxidoreductase
MLSDLTRFPRAPFAAALIFALGLVTTGVLLSEFMRLAACPLCIVQRMLYLLVALLALVGIAVAKTFGRRIVAAAMTVVAGAGMFVGGYQSWIQRFAQDTSCSGRPTWWEDLVDWAGHQAPILFRADGLCSDPGWKFLGLSIAEWSLVCFTLLFLLSAYTVLRKR